MPQYSFQNPDTGQVLTLEGDRPPTEQELDSLFAQYGSKQATPAPEAPKAGPERGIGTTLREVGTEIAFSTGGQLLGSLGGPAAPVTVPLAGAAGGGIGNFINQMQRKAEDPNYKFKLGEFFGSVISGGIPGGNLAKTGAKAVAYEAGKQGLGGLTSATVQKVADEGKLPTAKEAFLATAVPAALGGTAQKLLSGAKSSQTAVQDAFRSRPQKVKTFEAGSAEGLKVVPSDLDKSFGTSQLESLGGKTAVSQRTQLANQPVVNDMVKKDIGLALDQEISRDALKNIRAQEGQVYDRIDKVLTTIKGQKTLQDLRKMRGDAQLMWDAYFNSGGKNVDAQSKAIQLVQDANNLETAIDAALRKKGRADLADSLIPARQRIAKTYDVEEALNPGNFNIDPDVIARIDKRSPGKLTGNLKTLADFKNTFKNSLREESKVTSPDVSLLGTVSQGVAGAALGAATGNTTAAVLGALAIPVARKGAREYLLSAGKQRAAYEAALPLAKTPLGVSAAETALRETGQQAAKETTQQAVPSASAIEALRKNPSLAKEFDAKYGFGASRRYLKTR